MPRYKDPPHLWCRPERKNKAGKVTHKEVWLVIDEKVQTSTGAKKDEREKAEEFLHAYNVKKFADNPEVESVQPQRRPDATDPHVVLIGTCLAYYLSKREDEIDAMAPGKAREHLRHIADLNSFWGQHPVTYIKESTSKAFRKGRTDSVTRNKMILLRSIINYCEREREITNLIKLDYAVPDPCQSRQDTYTGDELIEFFKAAMRKRQTQHGKATYRSSKHIAKFMVVALATGTRASRVCQTSFYDEPGKPWLDLENGIYYRSGDGERVANNKRADAVYLDDRLIRVLKFWRDGSASGKIKPTRYLCEFNGGPIKDCSDAFRRIRDEVIEAERAKKLNRHSLKHTCVTYLIRKGVQIEDVGDYVSTDPATLRRVYKHVIAGMSKAVKDAMASDPATAKANRDAREKKKAELSVIKGGRAA